MRDRISRIVLSSGALVDWLGRRRLLALGAGAFATGTAGMALHPPCVAVLSPRVLCVGFGFGTLDAGLNVYIAVIPRSTGC